MSRHLNILTLNCGRMLQPRTAKFVRDLIHPDVLLLQDVPLRDLPMLERWPFLTFAPMTKHYINGQRAVVGIAIASRYFLSDITHHTVWGDGTLKDLQGIDNYNRRHLGAESDRLVEATEDRVVICATVHKDNVAHQVATTHGMWVREGKINEVQRKCMCYMVGVLQTQARERGSLILGGDLNFPRDGELYTFWAQYFRDCVPRSITTTLDPNHDVSRKGIDAAVDYVWDCGFPHQVEVSDIYTQIGASDHVALSATITKG